jgi:hypothetical protein
MSDIPFGRKSSWRTGLAPASGATARLAPGRPRLLQPRSLQTHCGLADQQFRPRLARILVAMSEPSGLSHRPFPAAPDEVDALLGALQRNRRTFAWKTGGLDADAMRCTLGPSTLSLGGLVKHLALVEDHYFTHQLHGRDYPAVWSSMADEEDWEWASAADDSPEQLRTLWLEAVARSEGAIDEALADGGLDRPLVISEWSETPNLRRVLVDLIEECARHTGHADLIRESIDGLVGEDAPQ